MVPSQSCEISMLRPRLACSIQDQQVHRLVVSCCSSAAGFGRASRHLHGASSPPHLAFAVPIAPVLVESGIA
jgi:hypothetical protein